MVSAIAILIAISTTKKSATHDLIDKKSANSNYMPRHYAITS